MEREKNRCLTTHLPCKLSVKLSSHRVCSHDPAPHMPPAPDHPPDKAQPHALLVDGAQASRHQALIDTTSRLMAAMYVYVALWLVITLVTGLHRSHPLLVWGTTTWLVLIAVIRAAVAIKLKALLAYRPVLAHGLTVTPVLANGLTWGLLTASSIYRPDLEPIRASMLLVGVGLSSGGTVAMAINPTLKLWFPLSVISPVAIATATHATDNNILLACLMAVYVIYVMQAANTVSKDYWRAQEAFSALERASLTDTLTQVANRLHFDRQYELEWRRACRLRTHLAVMIIDLDHFKRINDAHGHPAGDVVLQQTARAMRLAILRPCDLLARYGGEEFIALLPDISDEGAHVVAERVRTEVERLTVTLPSGDIKVTCSLGYACVVPEHTADADEFIRHADEALYQAKTSGRNRSQRWQPTQRPPVPPRPAVKDNMAS